VEKDAYRKRFDTSDAIILPMVQKGKVEETILESIPQLIIQILNTWQLGQLQRIPSLTIFSISLSALTLIDTIWYYAYWNLFRCMPIRDVPSTLALYNYKLSGVKDGPLSFAKASSEVVDVELSAMEMMSVTVSGTVLNDGSAGDEQLGQLPPKNEMGHASAAELTRASDAGASRVPVRRSPSDLMPDTDADMCRLRRENQEKEAEIAQLQEKNRQQNEEQEAKIVQLHEEKQAEIAQLQKEKWQLKEQKDADIAKLREENSRLRLELQRLASVALDSAGTGAQASAHVTQAAAAGSDNIHGVINSIIDCIMDRVINGNRSSSPSPATRAAITLQLVTRGYLCRRLFQARCSIALDSASTGAQFAADVTQAAAVESDNIHGIINSIIDRIIGGVVDGNRSCSLPNATRAAITLQCVTRGHLGRRLFQARCSQLARQLMNEPQ